jgi:hypothetical protein
VLDPACRLRSTVSASAPNRETHRNSRRIKEGGASFFVPRAVKVEVGDEEVESWRGTGWKMVL